MHAAVLLFVDSFGMTKLHKEIAMKLMESVNDEDTSDQAIIKVNYINQQCSTLHYTYMIGVIY